MTGPGWKLAPLALSATLVAFAWAPAARVQGAQPHVLPSTLGHVDPKAPCFRWPAQDYDGDGVFDRVDRCPDTPKGCVVDQYGCSIDGDHDGVCDGLDRCPNTAPGDKVDEHGCSASQRAALGEAGRASTRSDESAKAETPAPTPPPPPSAPVSETERQLVEGGRVRLENVYFETNSAKLLPESETSLNEAGGVLEKFVDLKIEVQGHTDMRGAARYNMKLSQARAESVRQYLLDHFRLKPENLVAKGYGETQPETKERNDEERMRDRRVVLRVLNPEALPHNVKLEH